MLLDWGLIVQKVGGYLTEAISSLGEMSDILTPFINFFNITLIVSFNFFIDREYFDFIKFIISSWFIRLFLLVFNRQLILQKPFWGLRRPFRIIRHSESWEFAHAHEAMLGNPASKVTPNQMFHSLGRGFDSVKIKKR